MKPIVPHITNLCFKRVITLTSRGPPHTARRYSKRWAS